MYIRLQAPKRGIFEIYGGLGAGGRSDIRGDTLTVHVILDDDGWHASGTRIDAESVDVYFECNLFQSARCHPFTSSLLHVLLLD